MRVFFILWLVAGLVRPAHSQAQPQSQQGDKQEPAIAEGRVASASTGEPVVRARVTIRPKVDAVNTENAPGGFSMETDDGGTFHFEKLDPGKYDITVTKAGYLQAQYGAKRVNGPGIPVTLTPGQTTSKLDIKLYPAATVSGVVTDDHGEPVQANVQLVKRTWRQGKPALMPSANALSDGLGHFRISDVQPGRYLLRAESREFSFGATQPVEVDRQGNPLNLHLVTTFLGDTSSADSATQIQIQPGQEVADANIRMHREPTFNVRGRVVSVPPNDSPLNYMASLMAEGGWFSGGFGGRPKRNGQFEIDHVPPGSYLLTLGPGIGPWGGGTSVPVEVSSANVDNLEVSIQPHMEIQGKISVENHPETDFSATEIFLTTGGMTSRESTSSADGSFTLHEVSPRQYQVRVRTPDQSSFVKSVRLGDREMPDRSIDLTQAAGVLAIVLSFSPAKVEGSVTHEDPDSQTAAAASAVNVVLVPEKRTEDYWGGVKFASTDGKGHFTFNGVEPGNYKAFAADGIDGEQWADPEVAAALSSHAADLELNEGDSKQIQLKLITAAEAAQVLDRLGL